MSSLSEIDRTELRIPVGSETAAGTRYRGASADPVQPTLFMYTPYHKDDYETFGGYHPFVAYLCHRGYDVVIVDVIGTGASSGSKVTPFDAEEGVEAATIIEWLADQPWSTGSIGMFGKSYGGTAALKAAAQNPPSLAAIVPIHAPWRLYDWGAQNYFGAIGNWCNLMQALQAMPPTYRDDDGRWERVWQDRLDAVGDSTPWQHQFSAHPQYDDYWRSMDVAIEDIRVPTFAVSGWRDGFPDSTVEYFEAVDAPKRLLLGPWRHVMPHRGRECPIDFRVQVADWFDRFLNPDEADGSQWPTVTYWTEHDGGGVVGSGDWHGIDRWPRKEDAVHDGRLYLVADRHLGEEPPTEQVHASLPVDYTVGLDSLERGPPTDTTPDDHRSLVFETEPASNARVLTGSPHAALAIDDVPAVLNVRLVDVAPSGEGSLISHGTVTTAEFVDAGRPIGSSRDDAGRYHVPLKAKSHRIETGHRLRLAVACAYFPEFEPVETTEQPSISIDPTRPSYVDLPWFASEESLDVESVGSMNPPVESPAPTAETIVNATGGLHVARERQADAAQLSSTSSTTIDLPAGLMHIDRSVTASVDHDTASSRRLTANTTIEVDIDDHVTTVEAVNRLTPAVELASTTVTENGMVRFDERWRQSATSHQTNE